jgi:GT2 family glycosyltransferase
MLANIGCVLVTFNRLEKLKVALESYDEQSLKPQYLIVVDNASTDGTAKYLKDWQTATCEYERIVIALDSNIGGSGGFYAGEELAITKKADWIMVADDDAYLAKNYIEYIENYINNHNAPSLAIICGAVRQQNSVFNEHRSIWKSKYNLNFVKKVPEEWFNKKEFEFDFTSYVGPVMNKQKLLEVGLVNKDFFIWLDDYDHAYRLHKVGKLICLPETYIIHDADTAHFDLSWKAYYGFRNKLTLIKKFGFLSYIVVLGVFTLKTLLCPIKGRSLTEVKIRLAGLKDAVLGNLGIHKTYKPGWKPK